MNQAEPLLTFCKSKVNQAMKEITSISKKELKEMAVRKYGGILVKVVKP